MEAILKDWLFLLFLIVIVGILVVLFVRLFAGMGAATLRAIRRERSYRNQSIEFLNRHLNELHRQNEFLERIAKALEQGRPPPK